MGKAPLYVAAALALGMLASTVTGCKKNCVNLASRLQETEQVRGQFLDQKSFEFILTGTIRHPEQEKYRDLTSQYAKARASYNAECP